MWLIDDWLDKGLLYSRWVATQISLDVTSDVNDGSVTDEFAVTEY